MFYDPRHDHHGLKHNPWLGIIVPRPIGWISTTAPDGTLNLAPYSSFQTLSSNPPFLMFSSDTPKDSAKNAKSSGYFCMNLATYALRDAMNQSSAPYPSEVSEFEATGLTPVPCRNIPTMRVKETPVAIECKLSQVVSLTPSTGAPCTNQISIGEVVGIHIDEAVIRDGLVDIDLMQPLARLGYRDYMVATTTFAMERPILENSDE